MASQVEVSGSFAASGVVYSGSASFTSSVASQSFMHEIASTESTRFKCISYCLEAEVSFDQDTDWSAQAISPSLAQGASELQPVSTMEPGTTTLIVPSLSYYNLLAIL